MSKEREPKYKLGDKVQLIVGGPPMAIKEVVVDSTNKNFLGSYKCQWFAGKKLDFGTFPEENLELATEDKVESQEKK